MDHHDHSHTLTQRKQLLWLLLVVNISVFAIEIWQGLSANSSALIADSMDFLGDSISYAVTIYVIAASDRARAISALIKAGLMLLLAVVTLAQGVHNMLHDLTPHYVTMGWVGALALAANVFCAVMLYRDRHHDINMQSVWVCSRNDVMNNIAILIAAFFVFTTQSPWPDLVASLFVAGLATKSALGIIKSANKQIKSNT